MKVNDAVIYLTDNGAAYCGKHLGNTARMTGRDISGQPIMAVTPEVAAQSRDEFGYIPSCETCGKVASLIVSQGRADAESPAAVERESRWLAVEAENTAAFVRHSAGLN